MPDRDTVTSITNHIIEWAEAHPEFFVDISGWTPDGGPTVIRVEIEDKPAPGWPT